jgi:hypothetical protein
VKSGEMNKFKDVEVSVRRRIAGRAKLPGDVVVALAADVDAGVRWRIAHRSTP